MFVCREQSDNDQRFERTLVEAFGNVTFRFSLVGGSHKYKKTKEQYRAKKCNKWQIGTF